MNGLNNIAKLSVALLMVAFVFSCSKDSQPLSIEPDPVPVVKDNKPVGKKINYSISVKKDSGSSTKVTLGDNKAQLFESGDRLKITGTNISGILTYSESAQSSTANFSGTLTYTGEGEQPAADLQLTATIINDLVTENGSTIDYSSAISIPSSDYATSLAAAVHQYSHLTATFLYGSTETISLEQKSAFISFDLYAYGILDNTDVTITITGGAQQVSKTLKAVSSEKALFTVAFAGGSTTLTNPVVTITGKAQEGTANERNVTITRPFGSKSSSTLSLASNKTYSVTDKAPAIGDVYYSDGTWSSNRQSNGATALGLIVYVNDGSSSAHPVQITDVTAIKEFANGVTEKNAGFGHALVMAFTDCTLDNPNIGIQWSNFSNNEKNEPGITDNSFVQEWLDWGSQTSNAAKAARNRLLLSDYMVESNSGGLARTQYMINANTQDGLHYLAADKIKNYGTESGRIPGTSSSSWFMPTITQWIASFVGLGESTASFVYPIDYETQYPPEESYSSSSVYDKFKGYADAQGSLFVMPVNWQDDKAYSRVGTDNSKDCNKNFYWSSTQNMAPRAICVGFSWNNKEGEDSKTGVVLAHHYKSRVWKENGVPVRSGRQVRAFLAF